ncbi:MAG: hypothetical protein HRU23_20315 [Gammaproteobacteria bacterium]|nr:hypothetical protein [Gammaproteobacteria bacterium]
MTIDRNNALTLIRTGLIDKQPVSNSTLNEYVLSIKENWDSINSKINFSSNLTSVEWRDLEAAKSWCINLANTALIKEREYRSTGEITDDYDCITIDSEKRLKDFFSNLSK